MKFNFKKIASVIASAVMLSGTVGFAAAVSYPAPFVQGGSADGAVVVGANAAPTDWAASVDISNDLGGRVSGTTTTTSSVTGEAKQLASGTDFIYLTDTLDQEVSIITDDDLPTVLASGTFTDGAGADNDYDQFIDIGDDAVFEFSDSDGDLDNPDLHIEMPSGTTPAADEYIYQWRIDFDDPLAFNSTGDDGSEGEEIVIAGKDYTIGTATDSNTIVLLGGSDQKTINVGESLTMEVNGVSYEVSLTGISDEATPKASIIINGESETFTEGQTKEVLEGLDVFVRTVFRTGDNSGYVIVEMGSDKLTIESGKRIKMGADDDNVDGTRATITGGVGACTSLIIAVGATDDDVDHLLEGDSFVDPVFGTVKVEFANMPNAPQVEGDQADDVSSTRRVISVERKSDNTLRVSLEEKSGGTATLEFADGTTAGAIQLEDDDDKAIEVVEGASLGDEEYVILNNGDNQHFAFVDDIAYDPDDGISITLTDKFGVKSDYELEDESDLKNNGDSVVDNIWGKPYDIELVDNSSSAPLIRISTTDYTDDDTDESVKAVYPYLETISGKDHRVAFTDYVQVLDEYTTNGSADSKEITLEFPTGTGIVVDNTGSPDEVTITPTGGSPTTLDLATEASVQVGTVYYNFNVTDGGAGNTVDMYVSINQNQNATVSHEMDAGILFVEEEDNADSDNKNAVIIPTTVDATSTQIA
jgi:hypothetical protein